MSLKTEEVEALRVTHGRVAHVKSSTTNDDGSPEWEVVLRKPKRIEYKAYRSMRHDDSRRADAQEELVRRLMVVPSGEDIDELIEEWPGIPEGCSEALMKLAGLAGQESAKK